MRQRIGLAGGFDVRQQVFAEGGVLVIDDWLRPEAWRDPGKQHALATGAENLAVAHVGWSHRSGNRTRLEMHHLIATRDGVEHVVAHHLMTTVHRRRIPGRL